MLTNRSEFYDEDEYFRSTVPPIQRNTRVCLLDEFFQVTYGLVKKQREKKKKRKFYESEKGKI
jgi:hypothetical protein